MKPIDESNIYSVSALNHAANTLLSEQLGLVWVTGEISNLSRPSSGHIYFSLKDDQAQVRCALFRFQHQQIDFQLEHGQAVVVQAQVGLYESRGDFQLIVSRIQLAGVGKLQAAFEKLKKELEKKGWFDEKYKKPLPTFPKQVGIITSATAAALQDILKVLKKRFAGLPIVIYPTLVQGDLAANQIAAAIQIANQRAECDVLLLARGGGSLEDLWPFNELVVATAIFDSKIPIITGIGHQTDFTIAGFVADVRAPTPSAAAEIISQDRVELAQRIDQLETQLLRTMRFILRDKASQLTSVNDIKKLLSQKIKSYREMITHLAHTLDTLNPVKILQRGFSVTRDKNNHVIKSAKQVTSGDQLQTQFVDGVIASIAQK